VSIRLTITNCITLRTKTWG